MTAGKVFSPNSEKGKYAKYLLICVTAFAAVLILNHFTIYTGDDYMYHFFFEQGKVTDSSRWLSGITDIPLSMYNHYNWFNGRIVAHSIVQFFMLFDKKVFDVCNSTVFLATGFLLLLNIQPAYKKWKPWHLGIIFLVMWLCLPDFGLSVLWVSGAVNYLWMTMFLLAFMLPYRVYHECGCGKGKNSFLKAVFMIPLALICGWSSENSGGAVIGLIFLINLIWLYEKRKIPAWSISGFLAACAGFWFLLKAPSSSAKMSTEFTIEVFLKRMRELIGFSYHYILLLYIVFLIISVIFIKNRMRESRQWVQDMAVPCAYMLSGIASVVVLIASPVIMGKSWIWAVCAAVCATGMVFRKLAEDQWYLKDRLFKGLVCVLIIWAIWNYADAYHSLTKTCSEFQIQVNEIQMQKEAGIGDVTIPLLSETESIYNPVKKTPNVSLDKDYWFNKWMALYYGVNSITGVEIK